MIMVWGITQEGKGGSIEFNDGARVKYSAEFIWFDSGPITSVHFRLARWSLADIGIEIPIRACTSGGDCLPSPNMAGGFICGNCGRVI
jgi:hypothetical protein